MRRPYSFQTGFTIVEMLVIVPIVLLTVGVFITAIVNMTGDVLASRGSNLLAYNVQDALNRIEDDVKSSTSFLAINNVALEAPQGYGDDTTSFANVDAAKGNMLILSTLATTANPIAPNNGFIYLANQPNSCTSVLLDQNDPMVFNVVYFIKNGTLWRRTIAPKDYATLGCSVPWQQPSCTPGYSLTFCKTQDVSLIDGVNPGDFSVQYFTTPDTTIANADASNTSKTTIERTAALQSTKTVSASLNVTKTAAGRTINQTGTIRVSRLDSYSLYASPVPTTEKGLVGWWTLDGNANDSSGNNNTGTVVGASLTAGQNGQSNAAYSFNGISNEITVADSLSISPTSAMSISVWAKATAFNTGTTQGIVVKDRSSGISNPPYELNLTSSNIFSWRLTDGDNATFPSVVCSEVTPTTGVWYHLVGTYDGTLRFYINGVACSATATSPSIADSTAALRFGQQKNGNDRWFNGSIDDVRMYNRAITSTEANNLYNAGAQ